MGEKEWTLGEKEGGQREQRGRTGSSKNNNIGASLSLAMNFGKIKSEA